MKILRCKFQMKILLKNFFGCFWRENCRIFLKKPYNNYCIRENILKDGFNLGEFEWNRNKRQW